MPLKKVITKPKLIVKEEENTKTKNNAIHKRVFNYSYAGKKDLSYKDTKKIYDTILKTGVKPENIYVQVMAERVLTLKSLEEEDFKDWDSEEYYSNRVADPGKFLNHFQWVRVCIIE